MVKNDQIYLFFKSLEPLSVYNILNLSNARPKLHNVSLSVLSPNHPIGSQKSITISF